MRELISLQEPQETKIILFFFCWQTKVYRTCGKQQKCKHLDFCNDLDKNLWKSLDKQPHLSRGLNSGPELQMQPETAAQQNPSASHQNGSSLREGQFLPVLFTATSQCLELWQDNIRVFTIWANSLPLCSRLDLASVFFFYFGCETVPLLPAPCRSLGESRLLQLQRLQVLQENHWGSQDARVHVPLFFSLFFLTLFSSVSSSVSPVCLNTKRKNKYFVLQLSPISNHMNAHIHMSQFTNTQKYTQRRYLFFFGGSYSISAQFRDSKALSHLFPR